jgi:hypothetical protein
MKKDVMTQEEIYEVVKNRLTDRIEEEEFPCQVREMLEYEGHIIVIRDPIEDHNPEESGEYEDEGEEGLAYLQKQYENDEVVDFTCYSVLTGEPTSASGGYFEREYAIEIAEGDIDCEDNEKPIVYVLPEDYDPEEE